MQLIFHRLKRRALAAAATITDWVVFVGIVLIGGLGTTWYMVDAGSGLTTQQLGSWSLWTSTARADADPYTRAHFARLGALTFSSDVASTYFATTDSLGQRLHSSCEYIIEGRALGADWWSLSVFDGSGRLIPNAAERYVFTSNTITPNPDGSFTVTMARDARPRNWLPVGGGGRLTLVLTLLGPEQAFAADAPGDAKLMPTVRRVECR